MRALAREKFDGVELFTAILPVDCARGPAELIRAFEQHQPEVVLCLGEASKRIAISIERVAINLMDYRIPDNAGKQAIDEPIIPGAPAAYFVTLPTRAMLNAARTAGIPAELSYSAGTYLCNQVTYAVLHYLASKNAAPRAGFAHLPALPEQVAEKYPAIPSMGLETMLAGIRAIIPALKANE